MMQYTFPDPEASGKSEIKPHEKINADKYASLFEFEEDNEED